MSLYHYDKNGRVTNRLPVLRDYEDRKLTAHRVRCELQIILDAVRNDRTDEAEERLCLLTNEFAFKES